MMKADLHIHTLESDGCIEPYEVVSIARYKGLSTIAVTDHDSFRGAVSAQRYAKLSSESIVVLAGAEVTTNWGHIIVLCSEPPLWTPPEDFFELRDLALGDNCILLAPHPFDYTQKSIGFKLLEYHKLFHGVEVWNASSIPLFNIPTLILADRIEAAWLASSDAHTPEEIGSAYTLIDASNPEAESILEAIRRKKTIPHPGLPSVKSTISRLAWSLTRRI